MNLDYQLLRGEESCGRYGAFGIKIEVAVSPKLPDLQTDAIWKAGYEAVEKVKAAIMEAAVAADPMAQAEAKEEREQLLALFPEPIHVETLPNGYCSQWCCKHLPWFLVTTKQGKVKIGWRKRVINIEWGDYADEADKLFPNEDVTKGQRYIHAWGLIKAKEYVNAILTNTPLKA